MSETETNRPKGSPLREPLLHFTLLGALLFVGHAIWSANVKASERTIEITPQITARLAAVFEAEQSRPPNEEEAAGLIVGYVSEQALSREAMRAGLDDGDTIITRRLAQKMRFMLEESTSPDDPGDAVLQAWLNNNTETFFVPEARAISHVYVSPQGRRHLDMPALELRRSLDADSSNWRELGDPFMMQRQYSLIDRTAMARIFGKAFTKTIFDLPPDTKAWHIADSAFGQHIVRLDGTRAGKSVTLEEVRPQVLADWQDAELRKRNARRIDDTIAKYRVTGAP